MPPQKGGRAGLVPCFTVTFATSAIRATREDRGSDCADAQAPSRLFKDRDA